ncbi:GntR family transcriptional regulator [Actinomadura yumaensis]|uniref:GntR family transcriptional regulator n=1 Tax=Actinomadura yumaensis TaxID=111807 RepID=UPI0036158740
MVRDEDGSTRAREVYARLRADIFGGRLAPGRRLKFGELRERYAASAGAIREALVALTSEGLVVSRPHQGFHVVPLSHRDLAELVEARLVVETRALWLSVRDGDTAWEAGVVAAFHVLERTLCWTPPTVRAASQATRPTRGTPRTPRSTTR